MGADVMVPYPLTRFPTLFPAQFGVPGTGHNVGLRAHSTGTVFYVDRNFPGVSDLRDGTEPDAPLATVAAALSKCQPHRGDIVLVMDNNSWQYGDASLGNALAVTESVEVTVPGVRIVGVSPSPIGVPWVAAADGQFALSVYAADVLVEGFAFIGTAGGSNGVFADWDGLARFGDNLVLRHCYFETGIGTAVQLEFSWYSEVSHCFFDHTTYGVYVDPAGSGIAYCRLFGNWCQDVATAALSLQGGDDCRVHGNWLFADTPGTDMFIDLTNGADNIVTDNWLGCPLGAGAGQYSDTCTAGAGDMWVNNHCQTGDTITNP